LRTRSEVTSSTSGFPVFTHNLWKILEDAKNKNIVTYIEDNTFQIANVNIFMHITLPRYYKMSNLKKFYKHLEIWGFIKLYGDVPTFKHIKWDKNDKACLHDISKLQVVQKKSPSRGVSQHLRSDLAAKKFAEKLETEIQHRLALEREVADLKKILERLSGIVAGGISETPKTDPTDVQSNNKSNRDSPMNSSKRSVESAEFVSESTPKKRRKITQLLPEIIVQNDQGSNPFVQNANPFMVGNAAFSRRLEVTSSVPPPRPESRNVSAVFDKGTRSPPTKRRNLNKAIVDCPENITMLRPPENITMLRPASPNVTSEIHDNVSLKTDVLEAQICWSEK